MMEIKELDLVEVTFKDALPFSRFDKGHILRGIDANSRLEIVRGDISDKDGKVTVIAKRLKDDR